MRPITTIRQLATADADGICLSQTPLAGGALTINGAFASGGVATLDVQRRVLITAAADESARTFVVTGTDDQGRVITETIAGPNATTAQSLLDFKTVTEITIDAASAGALTVGTSGVGSSGPIPLDIYLTPFQVSIFIEIDPADTVDGTVQYTNDDIWNGVGPFNWTDHSDLTNVTSDEEATLISPVTAIRLLTNSGTDPITMRTSQAGVMG